MLQSQSETPHEVGASWLIDETKPIGGRVGLELEQPFGGMLRAPRPALAVRLSELVVHDNRKWFGGAGSATLERPAI